MRLIEYTAHISLINKESVRRNEQAGDKHDTNGVLSSFEPQAKGRLRCPFLGGVMAQLAQPPLVVGPFELWGPKKDADYPPFSCSPPRCLLPSNHLTDLNHMHPSPRRANETVSFLKVIRDCSCSGPLLSPSLEITVANTVLQSEAMSSIQP